MIMKDHVVSRLCDRVVTALPASPPVSVLGQYKWKGCRESTGRGSPHQPWNVEHPQSVLWIQHFWFLGCKLFYGLQRESKNIPLFLLQDWLLCFGFSDKPHSMGQNCHRRGGVSGVRMVSIWSVSWFGLVWFGERVVALVNVPLAE